MSRGPSGRELDLGVQAADLHPECLDRRRGQSQHVVPLGLVEGGRDEEAGLPEVLGQGEATGEGQVADHPGCHHALHRDVGGVGPLGPSRVVGEVPLEDHVGAARAQGLEQPGQLGPVGGQERVAAPLGRPGLEDRRPAHLGLDRRQVTLGLLRPRSPGRRAWAGRRRPGPGAGAHLSVRAAAVDDEWNGRPRAVGHLGVIRPCPASR